MAERPKHWIKLWVSWLTTPAHLELSGGALGLGPLLLLLATWDGEYGSGGWLLTEQGHPMSRDALARAVHLTRAHLDRYLSELMACNTLTLRESDGAIGFAKFGRWQETASASRMRRRRANGGANSDGGCDVQSDAQTVDDRRQTTELATQATPPTPSRGVSSESPAEAAFLSHPPAKRAAKPRPTDARAQPVIDRIEKLRAELGLKPLQAAHATPRYILARMAEGADAATMLAAVEARAAEIRAGRGDQEYFNAVSMFTGPGSRGPGGWATSLVALERAGKRAPTSRGAAPPSPRPTRSGYHDPKTGQFVEDDFESVSDFLLETETDERTTR